MKLDDLTRRIFGKLTVSGRAPSVNKQTMWACICECGATTVAQGGNLKKGDIRSCGCLQRELASLRFTTHGQSRTPLYRVWQSMIRRCTKVADKNYPDYGGRGIRVCDRWRFGESDISGFECFLSDMGERAPGMSIDRYPNNDGNYEPSNCGWATQSEQCKNKRLPPQMRPGYRQKARRSGAIRSDINQEAEHQ